MENYFPAIRDINRLDEEELLKRFIRERKEGMYVDSPEKVSPQVLYVIKAYAKVTDFFSSDFFPSFFR